MPRTNRLAQASSPYLLQHAHNPVDWHPWGKEAFQLATSLNKPVFLSIGYATCHWCHVMERESFENDEVAAALNDTFICIKVDREERPDVDTVFMSIAQVLGGQTGWPLTLLLTPQGLPFFSATYLPAASAFGRMGVLELCQRVSRLWPGAREDMEEAGRSSIARAQASNARQAPAASPSTSAPLPDATMLRTCYTMLAETFDATHGGFGHAPKFPTPHILLFLLDHGRRTATPHAIAMADTTLRAMRRGGIFDHVGLGFHRYATDAHWLVPHFEKMLYDQALLCMAYLDAYQTTGLVEHAETARQICTYVLRDLTAPAGGFHTAEDADSEGEEGRFYVFTHDAFMDVASTVAPDEAATLAHIMGVTAHGNYHDEATGVSTGNNILHLPYTNEAMQQQMGLDAPALAARLETLRLTLLARRNGRTRPQKDDKILADQNGLMIAALAMAARLLQEPAYAQAAAKAAHFVLQNMRTPEGGLLHCHRNGTSAVPAFLDDYAFLAWGLLELEKAAPQQGWAAQAITLVQQLRQRFRHADGGFYQTEEQPSDGVPLPYRPMTTYDAAMPSGNAVAAHVMLQLGHSHARPDLLAEAHTLLRAIAPEAMQYPAGFCHYMSGLALAHAMQGAGAPAAAT